MRGEGEGYTSDNGECIYTVCIGGFASDSGEWIYMYKRTPFRQRAVDVCICIRGFTSDSGEWIYIYVLEDPM
jgi:hypothetical protein